MSTVIDKAKVSGIVGLVGAITAIFSGYVNFALLSALSAFFITMLIQYGEVKIKILVSLSAIFTFIVMFISNHGWK